MKSEIIGNPDALYIVDESPHQITSIKPLNGMERRFPTNPIEKINPNINLLIDYRKIADIAFNKDFSSLFFNFLWKNRVSSVEQEPYILFEKTDLIEFNKPAKLFSTKKISVLFHINEYKKGKLKAAKE